MTLRYRYFAKSAYDLLEFSKEVIKIEKTKLFLWFARVNQYAWKIDINELDSFVDFDNSFDIKLYLDVRIETIDLQKIIHFYIRGEIN